MAWKRTWLLPYDSSEDSSSLSEESESSSCFEDDDDDSDDNDDEYSDSDDNETTDESSDDHEDDSPPSIPKTKRAALKRKRQAKTQTRKKVAKKGKKTVVGVSLKSRGSKIKKKLAAEPRKKRAVQVLKGGLDLDMARNASFMVFDLETTGLSRTERIIEIAVQELHAGKNSCSFHTLVNPGCAVPNSHVHGITTKMVRKSGVPRMEELIPVLLRFIKTHQKRGGYVVLVAHNARRFDVPILANEFRRCSTAIPSNWLFLDTLPLAREAMQSTGGSKFGSSLSLQALRERYRIPLVGSAHRAMSDVHSLSLVLQRIAFDLKLPIGDLVQRAFSASELNYGKTKKRKVSKK